MALTDQRVSALLLQMRHSRQEASSAIRSLQSVRRELENTAKAGKSIGASTAPMDKLTGSIHKQDRQVRALAKSADAAAKEFDQLRASIRGAAQEDIGGAAGGGRQQISSRLAGLGREVRALPAIAIPGAGSLTTDAIGKVTAALAGLPPVAGPVLIGLAGIGAAFVALETSLAGAKKAVDEAVASVTFYYQEVRRLTTEANRERRTEIQQQLEDDQAELERLVDEFGGIWGELTDEGALAGSALELVLAQLSGADDAAAARVQELEASINQATGQIAALDRAIDDDTAARNDNEAAARELAEAERELAEARARFTDRLINVDIQTILRGATLTQAQLDERLAAIDREQAVLQEYIAAGNLSAEATEQLRLRLADLGVEESRLTMTIAEEVAAREAAAEAAQIAADKEALLAKEREQAAASLEKVLADIQKTSAEITKLTADNAAKIKEIAEALNEKLADAEADRNEKLADAERDANERRVEAAQETAENIQRIEREHRKNLEKIEREFNRSAAEAIQDRNAVALDRAEQARAEALADEEDSYKEGRDRVNAQLKKTNAEIDKRLAEQRNIAIKRYNEQVAAAIAAANKQRQIEIQKYNAELMAKQQHLNMLQQQEQAYRAAALGLQKSFFEAMLQLASSAIGAVSGSSKEAPQSREKPGQFKKFDSGPPVMFDRRQNISVTKGDLLFPPGSYGSVGGVNISINGMGMNRRQVREAAIDALDEALDRAERASA